MLFLSLILEPQERFGLQGEVTEGSVLLLVAMSGHLNNSSVVVVVSYM